LSNPDPSIPLPAAKSYARHQTNEQFKAEVKHVTPPKPSGGAKFDALIKSMTGLAPNGSTAAVSPALTSASSGALDLKMRTPPREMKESVAKRSPERPAYSPISEA